MRIGLVFEGGGGKGAYQIGAWKAIRELGIERHICMVSGTSVGALNAALFYKGNYGLAEEIWKSISEDDILSEKINDDYLNGECFFSQNKLGNIISEVLRGKKYNWECLHCYVTCKYRGLSAVRYFDLSKYRDVELKKRILMASSAIPIVFESVEIEGTYYVDGGVNGDNVPIKPLLSQQLNYIIVIHLNQCANDNMDVKEKIYEVFPTRNLGGLLSGTLDFGRENIAARIRIGYEDTLKTLRPLADSVMLDSLKASKNNSKSTRDRTRMKKVKHILSKIEKGEMKMADFDFTNEKAKRLYEEKYEKLKKLVNDKVDDTDYLWDATAQKYAVKMERVKRVLQSEGISDHITTKMFKDIDVFLTRCANAEFHIALVGAIKAGKSTLINALLGHEYASTKVTPETAALTKFRKDDTNYVKVKFYSSLEWDSLWQSAVDAKAKVFLEEYESLKAEDEKQKWLDQSEKVFECDDESSLIEEIQKWTSSKSVCHYFVKEVEVGLKEFAMPEGVVLVDTPGLDDVVQYRSNITREYIDRANAVLVCVKSDALTGSEWGTICSVFANTRYNPEKVYIIATQVDALNRPRENWADQREEWIKYLKGDSAFASLELAKNNLVPVSAYLYTLLKEYNSLSEDDDKKCDLDSIVIKLRARDINEKYQELLDFTKIDLLKAKLQTEIITHYKELLIEDISSSYDLCKDTIRETMDRIKAAQAELVKTSQGGIEEIQKKQQEYEGKCKMAEQDKKELEDMLKKLKVATTQRADELEKAIKELSR